LWGVGGVAVVLFFFFFFFNDTATTEIYTLSLHDALPISGDGPAFAAVRRTEEVYVGDAPGGWDLVLELAAGLHVRSRNTTPREGHLLPLGETGMYLPSGVHTPVGMVAAGGRGVEARGRVAECDLHQVAASVLAVMGVPAPRLDGTPFPFVTAAVVSSGHTLEDAAADRAGLNQEEEAEVLDRLRGLGYVD